MNSQEHGRRYINVVFELDANRGASADKLAEMILDEVREQPDLIVEQFSNYGDFSLNLIGAMIYGGNGTTFAVDRPTPQHNDVMGTTCDRCGVRATTQIVRGESRYNLCTDCAKREDSERG